MDEIANLIDAFLDLRERGVEEDEEYQGGFATEGSRKSQYIVDDLLYREGRGQLATNELGYLCIGGADGSEVVQVMESTGIRRAVIIEISDAGAEMARGLARKLASSDAQLVVFQGDAGMRLPDAVDRLARWRDQGEISGIVVSAQAVLHELPTRSPSFELGDFIGKAFHGAEWDVCAFYSREPCLPQGWPERVRLRIPGVNGDQLAAAATLIRDRLRMFGEVVSQAQNWVSLPMEIGVETLHKLIRGGGIRRVRYELGERLTSLDAMEVKQHLQSFMPSMEVEVDFIITEGFKEALRTHSVQYVGAKSDPLPMPRTHAEIVGCMASRQAPMPKATLGTIAPRLSAPLPKSALESVEQTFGREISESSGAAWLSQFTASELPIIERLVDHYCYLDTADTDRHIGRLHAEVLASLGGRLDDVIFVPLGGVAHSGELIAYHYRQRERP